MLSGLRRRVAELAGQPLVQFLVLGAIFYGLYAWIGAGKAGVEDRVIRVTVADVSRLDAGWQARYNRPPTKEELAGLVREYVREIALYRHAVVDVTYATKSPRGNPIVEVSGVGVRLFLTRITVTYSATRNSHPCAGQRST